MIAKKPAGCVTNDDVGVVSRGFAALLVKRLGIAPENRPPTRDFQIPLGDEFAVAIIQCQIRLAGPMPWG